MQMQLKVVGMREFEKQLNRLSAALSKEARITALKAGGQIVQEAASDKAPRSDNPTSIGHMADNIVVKTTINKKHQSQVSVGPDAKHWYGVFAEFGTSHHAAQPFLRPAIDENEDAVQDRIRQVLRAEILRLTGA